MAVNYAIYQIVLYSETGSRLAIIDDYRSLQFQKVVNKPGFFTLILNENDPKRDLFVNNGIIQVMRKIPGVIDWYVEFEGHIENLQTDVFQNGNQQFTTIGSSFNGLLNRRIIAYYEDSVQASKNAVAETVMKEYTNENIGVLSLISNARFANGNFANFIVAASAGSGDNWEGDRTGKNLLEVLQEISNLATIDFSVSTNITVGNYIFNTFVGQLGLDRTTTGLDSSTGLNASGNAPHIFSPQMGNVQTSLVATKHRKEKNRVFIYGQGSGATRSIVSGETADTFSTLDFINLRETMRGGGSQSSTAQLTSKASESLENLKTIEKFQFVPADIPSSLYGVHYNVGDKVTVKVAGVEANKKIIGVTISVGGNRGESNKRFVFEDIPT